MKARERLVIEGTFSRLGSVGSSGHRWRSDDTVNTPTVQGESMARAAGDGRGLRTLPYFDICRFVKTLPLRRLHATDEQAKAFQALAHRARLEVFFFLVRAGREVAVGEIQAELEIPGPTLSHHLDLLRRAGLVRSRKEERYVYYSTRPEMVTELVRVLTACC
jgi:DNA-binding transcriptional ArsR family regulator